MAIGLISIMMFGGMGMGAVQIIPPAQRGFNQMLNAAKPNELVGVLDIVSARYRGLVDKQQYDNELLRQGLNDDRREWIYKVSENLLNIVELINLFRRGAIDQMTRLFQGCKLPVPQRLLYLGLRV